jgi:hypothetical protein
VDSGTRLLLKALAKEAAPRPGARVLDSGCGVGVIGIALALAEPESRVLAQDRDALAAHFTESNARLNGIGAERLSATASPLLWGLGQERFDLVVSNIPAKAGEPVLRDFFLRAPRFLAPEGAVAVVIVNTLAPYARERLAETAARIAYEDVGPGHSVFVWKPEAYGLSPGEDEAELYVRTRAQARCAGREYPFQGLWGLEGFERPSFAEELLAELCLEEGIKGDKAGTTLFLGPRSGHLPLALRAKESLLASRDALALMASARNLGLSGLRSRALCLPDLLCLGQATWEGTGRDEAQGVDSLMALPELAPGRQWQEDFWVLAESSLPPGGTLGVASDSSEVQRFAKYPRTGWALKKDRKRSGFRACLYQRRG